MSRTASPSLEFRQLYCLGAKLEPGNPCPGWTWELLAQTQPVASGPVICPGWGRCGPQVPFPDLGSLSPTGGLCVVAVISFDLYLETVRSRVWDLSQGSTEALNGYDLPGLPGEEKAVPRWQLRPQSCLWGSLCKIPQQWVQFTLCLAS